MTEKLLAVWRAKAITPDTAYIGRPISVPYPRLHRGKPVLEYQTVIIDAETSKGIALTVRSVFTKLLIDEGQAA